jgi:hypothetical protein
VVLAILVLGAARVGPAVRDRMELQTAADAAALASATWSARECNLRAQAHQTQAQLAAGIALLRAAGPARARAEAALDSLLASGAISADAIAAERRVLADWEAGLNGLQPLADPGNPDGLWAAVEAVDSLAAAIAQAVPAMVERDAGVLGRMNGADGVVLWPPPALLPAAAGDASGLRDAARAWVDGIARRWTDALPPSLLSDARTLYREEARAGLDALLGDPSFPAHPAVWRRDAKTGLDRVAVVWRGGTDGGRRRLATAQARPVNPVRGNLATARWTARLVPADLAAEAVTEGLPPFGPDAPALRLPAGAIEVLTCH